ncbi:MAG TPA: hypothetical protein VF517_12845 [Thermoleophilaceae bacterium]|jgi:hypothetical protein
MRHKIRTPREERLAALAARASRQYGILAIWQLSELGFTPDSVKRLVAARRLHRLYRGVYALGHRSLAPRGRVLAAVYAYGPDAVASHLAAAWVHDLRRSRGSVVHVTVVGKERRARAGTRLHAVRTLHTEDVTVVEGIPVTSVARTLTDLGASLSEKQLRRTFEEADRRGLLDASAVRKACERGRGRRGIGNARVALAEYRPDSPKTRSDLEIEFLEFCRANGIPEPSVNVWVEGQEVDMAWLDRGVVVELDSYEYHGTRAAFERDRVRSAELEVARWRPIRVTSQRMQQATALRSHLLSLLAVSD